MNRRISVRAMIIKDDKLFCVRQKPYNDLTSNGNDWWCLPGGKLEANESLVDGLVREIIEELGVTPVVGNLLYIQQFSHEGQESLEFFFGVTNADDFAAIDLNQTTHGELEIAEAKFIVPAHENVLPKFLATEDIFAAAANNLPTKIFSLL